jgi:hypothetical protein
VKDYLKYNYFPKKSYLKMLLKLRKNHKKRLQLNLLDWAKWEIKKKIQKVKIYKKFKFKIKKL